jgi:pimeloyl-ACP methyl ester carboxylesterase
MAISIGGIFQKMSRFLRVKVSRICDSQNVRFLLLQEIIFQQFYHMKKIFILLVLSLKMAAQSYTPKTESCECQFKADKSLKTTCGYLLVPENRTKKGSRIIKLPYIIAESANPNKKKDPVLFATGGPGGSSIEAVTSIHYFSLIKDRDFIAFEQRGTKYAQPCLECPEVTEAIKQSYFQPNSKEKFVNDAVLKCRKKLIASGVDLSGYNSEESSNDLNDLINTLKLDSVNLIGMSYSGGLMPNVLRKYPNKIRSLVLDSPLPFSVNIDEDEIANFYESVHATFEFLEKESADNIGLENQLKNYLLSIEGKIFETDLIDEKTKKSLKIYYTRNDIIDLFATKIGNEDDRKSLPKLLMDLIKNQHKPHIESHLENIMKNNNPLSAMRLSVYCSDKMAYADLNIAKQQYNIHPYMKGYWSNDITPEMCKCWNVPAIKSENKKPFYSNTPALLSAGVFDAACRPVYNEILSHYLPNSQRLLFLKGSHCPLISLEGERFITDFLNNPSKKLESNNNSIKVY